MRIDRRSLGAGVFFAAFGVFYGGTALRELDIGSSFRMGPGYFPLALGILMVLFGGAIAIRALAGREGEENAPVPWRALAFLSAAAVFFGITARGLGLVPTIFLSSALTVMASPGIGVMRILLVSAALTVFCVIVFVYGLGLPMPLIGPWLGG